MIMIDNDIEFLIEELIDDEIDDEFDNITQMDCVDYFSNPNRFDHYCNNFGFRVDDDLFSTEEDQDLLEGMYIIRD
jgi:hypothetical protein